MISAGADHYGRTPDPGACLGQRAVAPLIENQIWKEHNAPLWNPYWATALLCRRDAPQSSTH